MSKSKPAPRISRVIVGGKPVAISSPSEAESFLNDAPATRSGGVSVEIEGKGVHTLTGRFADQIEGFLSLLGISDPSQVSKVS